MDDWITKRGIALESFAISSVTPNDDSAKLIEEFQASRVYTNANMLGARLGTAQASAMVNASSNTGGAMNAFMGMNMAQNAGSSFNVAELLSVEEKQVKKEVWQCSCGAESSGKFCSECGNKKVDLNGPWVCNCGNENKGKFCSECGNTRTI